MTAKLPNQRPSILNVIDCAFSLVYFSVICPYLDSKLLQYFPSAEIGAPITCFGYLIIYSIICLNKITDPGTCLMEYVERKRSFKSILEHIIVLFLTAICTCIVLNKFLPGHVYVSWVQPKYTLEMQFLIEFGFSFFVAMSSCILRKVYTFAPEYLYIHLLLINLILAVSKVGFTMYGAQLTTSYAIYAACVMKDYKRGWVLSSAVFCAQFVASVLLREKKIIKNEERKKEIAIIQKELIKSPIKSPVKSPMKSPKPIDVESFDEPSVVQRKVTRRVTAARTKKDTGNEVITTRKTTATSSRANKIVIEDSEPSVITNSSIESEAEKPTVSISKKRDISKPRRSQSPIKTRAARARAQTNAPGETESTVRRRVVS